MFKAERIYEIWGKTKFYLDKTAEFKNYFKNNKKKPTKTTTIYELYNSKVFRNPFISSNFANMLPENTTATIYLGFLHQFL